jgi:predicted Zn-dependent peptidase
LIACLAALALSSAPHRVQIDSDATRLRTVLPNGAVILAERTAPVGRISVQLWASAEGLRDKPRTNGFRHLLEHLIAKGTRRDLDQRLETAGGFLEARTYRDAMVFQVTVAPNQLAIGLSTIEEILHMGQITAQDIERESRIMSAETELRDDSALLASAAWSAAYGDYGLDAFGDLDAIRQATPTALIDLHRQLFVPSRLALTIVGDVDLNAATLAAQSLFTAMPKSPLPKPEVATYSPGVTSAEAHGYARAAEIGSFRETTTVAALAAALSVASEVPQSFVTYTPSNGPSLIIVGVRNSNGELEKALAKPPTTARFAVGRILASRWLKGQLDDPESIGASRGRLLCQSPSLRPETLDDNLAPLTYDAFVAGFERFSASRAVTVEGSK